MKVYEIQSIREMVYKPSESTVICGNFNTTSSKTSALATMLDAAKMKHEAGDKDFTDEFSLRHAKSRMDDFYYHFKGLFDHLGISVSLNDEKTLIKIGDSHSYALVEYDQQNN
jgi:hypothetical protein